MCKSCYKTDPSFSEIIDLENSSELPCCSDLDLVRTFTAVPGLQDVSQKHCCWTSRPDFQKSSLGLVAQWIRHRPTEPGIVGSSPTKVMVCPTAAVFLDELVELAPLDVVYICHSRGCGPAADKPTRQPPTWVRFLAGRGVRNLTAKFGLRSPCAPCWNSATW